jgi:HTH-type transcriptional regulator/antitoxin HigA
MSYTIIKTSKQYKEYCRRLKNLANMKQSKAVEEEMELIELLLDKWENDHLKTKEIDPIVLLKSLMDNKNVSRNELLEVLEITKGALSQILNYKKGLSKNVIRKLSEYFKVSQEAFNRNYPLVSESNRGHKDEKMMNYAKELETA